MFNIDEVSLAFFSYKKVLRGYFYPYQRGDCRMDIRCLHKVVYATRFNTWSCHDHRNPCAAVKQGGLRAIWIDVARHLIWRSIVADKIT